MFIKRAGSRAGFTLVELMVASMLSLVIGTAIATLSFYSGRSFTAMANYTQMAQQSQMALDRMSRDIRQAKLLTAYPSNSVTLSSASGTPLTFTYSPAQRTLVRVSGGNTTTYLKNCDTFQFQLFQHTVKSNTFDCYDAAVITNARVIQVNWKCSRPVPGSRTTTENALAAKIALRNK